MSRYSLTAYIAEDGTTCLKEDGTSDTSKVGHMWVSLNDNAQNLKECYGLHPNTDGSGRDEGTIKTTDNYTYQADNNTDVKKYTFDLNEWEYNNLKNHCQDQRDNHPKYLGSVSDCVHWTFDVLQKGAIVESNTPTSVMPRWNKDRLKEAETYWKERHEVALSIQPTVPELNLIAALDMIDATNQTADRLVSETMSVERGQSVWRV